MTERMKIWLDYTGQKWKRLNRKARVETIFEMQFHDLDNPPVRM